LFFLTYDQTAGLLGDEEGQIKTNLTHYFQLRSRGQALVKKTLTNIHPNKQVITKKFVPEFHVKYLGIISHEYL
jgi:hypothetical protein